ncbi:MAG: PD-(D/E)XK nuclease family protein, partial [Spirochaetota bacterium]
EAVLEVRIDRLARRGTERAIVDFKKRDLPTKAALLAGEAEGEAEGEAGSEGGEAVDGADDGDSSQLAHSRDLAELGDSQIASYVALAASAGMEVSRAGYWSIEKASGRLVVGEGGLRSREGYSRELAALDLAIGKVASGIRSGNFRYAEPTSAACGGCATKGLCRSHFATG